MIVSFPFSIGYFLLSAFWIPLSLFIRKGMTVEVFFFFMCIYSYFMPVLFLIFILYRLKSSSSKIVLTHKIIFRI